jgi:hypothetical protein
MELSTEVFMASRLVDRIRTVLTQCGEGFGTQEALLQRAEAVLRDLLALRPFQTTIEAWKATEALGQALPAGTDAAEPLIHDPRFLQIQAEDGHLYALVGDLHGDYAAFEEILRSFFPVGLGDAEAERRHVYLLGDILDRGRRDFQLLHAVLELRLLLGDRFVLLRGNHEMLSMKGDTVHSEFSPRTFLDAFGEVLPVAFWRAFVDYLAWLPHLALIRFDRGSVALFHAGVPPGFLQSKAEAMPDYLEVDNVRKAFLVGRGPVPGPRPDRPYPFGKFYREDLDDFCRHFDVKLMVRGHDMRSRGYTVEDGGRFITIFSSGTAMAADSGYQDEVCLPRFLVLDGARLFRGEHGEGEHRELDGGISVREVFHRDLVLILDSGSERERGRLLELARSIKTNLDLVRDLPVHVMERPGYTTAVAPPVAFLPPIGAHDRELDKDLHARYAFLLSVADADFVMKEWAPPTAASLGRNLTLVRGSDQAAFVRECAARIATALDFASPSQPPS